jgi:hypothetical protein
VYDDALPDGIDLVVNGDDFARNAMHPTAVIGLVLSGDGSTVAFQTAEPLVEGEAEWATLYRMRLATRRPELARWPCALRPSIAISDDGRTLVATNAFCPETPDDRDRLVVFTFDD